MESRPVLVGRGPGGLGCLGRPPSPLGWYLGEGVGGGRKDGQGTGSWHRPGAGSAPDLVRSPGCSGEVTGTPQPSPAMVPPSSNGLVPGAGRGRALWGGSSCHLPREPVLGDAGRPSSQSEDALQELVSPRVASTVRPAWQPEQVRTPPPTLE